MGRGLGQLVVAGVLAVAACTSRSEPKSETADPTICVASCGAWRSSGRLPVPRMQAAAAVRAGKIYVIGGQIEDPLPPPAPPFVATTAVDILDPATGAWTAGPPLPADAPKEHLAVAVQDDVIYLLNGYVGPEANNPKQIPTNRAYKLSGVAWERLADFPEARGAGATAQSIGGKLYVAGGGTDETAPLADTFVYDPAANTWSKLAPLPTPRTHVASCVLGGKMFVLGGFDASAKTLATTEAFDPADGPTGTWRPGPDMIAARGAASAIALGGSCYVLGGFHWAPPSIVAALERFEPSTNLWSTLAPLPEGRHSIALAPASSGIFAIGGSPVPFAGTSDGINVFTP